MDVIRASDWITVSWNYFHDHYKASLVGNNDQFRAIDFGYLHLTYHHNYFRNLGTRGNAGRFGHQHLYNNYYKDFRYQAIHSRSDNQVLVEGNVFTGDTREALSTYGLVIPEDSPNTSPLGDFEIDGKTHYQNEFIVNSVEKSNPKLHSFYEDNCKKNQYAYKIAKDIYGGLIMIYGTSLTEPIVSRFRSQIAENAKLLASHHILPELNHNEIEGFGTNPFPDIPRHVVWIKDQDDHKQVEKRMRITSGILKDIGVKNIYININNSTQDNFVTRSLKLIYLTDWISYYLAEFNNVDSIPVDTIMKLKNKML
mgnify:CR=1 FL=1